MEITWDPAKRDATLAERGLDFADAALVFDGVHFDIPDRRFDYGEVRIATFGFLRLRMVSVVWTARGESRRIISMRYANDRERRRFEEALRRMGGS
ncbi:BrnT family toxin [Siculibacillus lacustris]|uniref:BrnT family toxin n=1 Tax=Siculibacillus lacustris TaxID=1549641 RepID=A0A4V2KTS2_9HYPH|nr:BrnT family toxin [Siculibacillus lacustris]TBW38467.1 BrnT family toxin [Siculibacillus lacustris]